MDDISEALNSRRLAPINRVARALCIDQRTLTGLLREVGISVVHLGPRKRCLRLCDVDKLIAMLSWREREEAGDRANG
jgi:hypothetical protein